MSADIAGGASVPVYRAASRKGELLHLFHCTFTLILAAIEVPVHVRGTVRLVSCWLLSNQPAMLGDAVWLAEH